MTNLSYQFYFDLETISLPDSDEVFDCVPTVSADADLLMQFDGRPQLVGFAKMEGESCFGAI